MARKEKFDYAGEGALVEDEGVRSACVKAATDLEVFFLSRQGLQDLAARMGVGSRQNSADLVAALEALRG